MPLVEAFGLVGCRIFFFLSNVKSLKHNMSQQKIC